MRYCGFQHLSKEVCSFPKLTILHLEGNNLRELPDCFNKLSHLKVLFLGSNEFTLIPHVISRLLRLKILDMRNNSITEASPEALPKWLEVLTLTKNELTSF